MLQVDNAFNCSDNGCKRSVKVEIGTNGLIVLYPNETATFNGNFIRIPKTVSKTVLVEKFGDYTLVGLTSGNFLLYSNIITGHSRPQKDISIILNYSIRGTYLF